ncbi:hypothetical protein Zmor_018446 [Zophobas morio]|uniref:Ankyrin repeat protein n=1 Tax=Zophobas morio TaxID=2755281 RepID=A0AA38IA34_9CUCU|nr:hypothetical protein Zmor_018446 [Zophobas morio]
MIRVLSQEDWNYRLRIASRKGDLEEVERCLQNFADIDSCSDLGNTALSFAALPGHVNIVRYLCAEGANINKMAKPQGRTPLSWAVQGCSLDVVKILLEMYPTINAADYDGKTPLINAILESTTDIASMLINAGADINGCNASGNTPLAIAVENNRLDMVQLLLENNADISNLGKKEKPPLSAAARVDINAINSDGNTALTYAVEAKNDSIVEFLIEHDADPCKCGKNGKTPLRAAVEKQSLPLITYLLDHGAESTIQTAFLVAIETRNLDIIRLLIQKGVNLNAAYNSGHTPLTKALELGYFEIAEFLVENGADCKSYDKSKLCLFDYVSGNNLGMIEFLVKLGVSLDLVGSGGYTPLTKAAEMENFKLVKYLVEKGAKLNQPDENGKNALSIAAVKCSFRIVKYLLDAGADREIAKTELDSYASWNDDVKFCLKMTRKEEDIVTGTGHEEADTK